MDTLKNRNRNFYCLGRIEKIVQKSNLKYGFCDLLGFNYGYC